jgi:hypothetical protein
MIAKEAKQAWVDFFKEDLQPNKTEDFQEADKKE